MEIDKLCILRQNSACFLFLVFWPVCVYM